MENRKHSRITDQIICCFYNVYNHLGYGFLEKVYENVLMIELKEVGLSVTNQQSIKVIYKEICVGEYLCDLFVEQRVIVEIKAARVLLPEHEAQLLNYLNATDAEVGLLLNFGPEPQVKRKAFDNKRKKLMGR